ncbi:hypothetical protein [Lentzea sp. NBRC 102530]|uniref:DUF6928 family protein n=1 Tax=Lentzea sp. NBRC 102530 TaxID=3032201 RepID=UPI0024A415EB|nr:hypothetical protein [Lentzea sp. NBRC 102530]GLY51253.1 hypothetical protein Lesp01_49090 [Lentzea sp. NBRC 102530]
MGAKAAMVVFGDARALRHGGDPDRSVAEAVIRALHPDRVVEPVDDGDLADDIYPPDGHAYVAVLPDATIVCDQDLATVPAPEHVLDYADNRPLTVFAQHSGSGWLAYAEWTADGTLLRSHSAESQDSGELAESIALHLFGFTAESSPDLLMHGFRVIRPDQAEREAEMAAIVAQMAAQGPQRLTLGPDGSWVPRA